MKILLICVENNNIPDVLYTFQTLYLLLRTENNCLTTYFADKYIVNLASLSPMCITDGVNGAVTPLGS